MAEAGSGLMTPPPAGPGQGEFRQLFIRPYQAVQQPAHLGHRQRYQCFSPLRFSPFLPLPMALACCRTTAR